MINRAKAFIRLHQKYAPILFFVGGFAWDSLTLGRIDGIFDRAILLTYLIALSACLYLFNLADDGKWKETFLEKYEEYFPLAIQFFIGGLCSAYVIYFSRSVSYSKSVTFFIILIGLMFANELLKDRISNKYMQFSAYFFVNFTFFTFFLPVLLKHMNQFIFLLSGVISLGTTLWLILYIYKVSPSTREQVHKKKILALIIGIYLMINTFYFFNLIPPVPLAMDQGLVAHNIEKQNDEYTITYEKAPFYKFWRDYGNDLIYKPGERVYIFTSIFAPSDFEKSIYHRWKWYSPNTEKWELIDRIGFNITGGRDEGFRGYTYKGNMMEGDWKVDVITSEGLVLGIINFSVVEDSTADPKRLVSKVF